MGGVKPVFRPGRGAGPSARTLAYGLRDCLNPSVCSRLITVILMGTQDSGLEGWKTKPLVSEDQLNWSAWIQGFFRFDLSSDDPAKRIYVRNFQELYTRDVTVVALGDVSGRKGLT